jgi:epoxyqueuosine reductase QueG
MAQFEERKDFPMKNLSETVIDFAKEEGTCAAGIATVETLAGGPPSADLTYILPEAKSAICYAVPLDQKLIPPYLSKKDRRSHERDNFRTNLIAGGIALQLSKFLIQKGHSSVPLAPNEVYRQDSPRGALDMYPDISLRYLAVRSGVGSFGLSGNVLTKEAGAAVILGAVVTSAELEPTEPLSKEDTYCDNCRLCMASCASEFMDPEEETTVSLGGKEFSYSKRRSYLRCEYVCGGFTGLHSSGKWSTWSPGRFPLPKDDSDFVPVLMQGIEAYNKRPPMEGGHQHVLMESKLYLTCGNCQLICSPDKKERKRRHKMLTSDGVVVQNSDGSLDAVEPEAAIARLAALAPAMRALYEEC